MLENKFHISGIGFSFPGLINSKTGQAILAGAIVPLHGCNIKEELLGRLENLYPVWVENDANCAALAEIFSGNAREVSSAILLTLGTGVGGAIIQDGTLIRGSGFRAGEFGMMVTDYHHSGYQTLHHLASTSALVNKYRVLHHIDADTTIRGEDIFANLEDTATNALVDEWATFVAITIFNVVATLDPEKILIGGGISQNEMLLPILEKALNKNDNWKNFKVPIETCLYHNDSGLLGALYLIETNGGEK